MPIKSSALMSNIFQLCQQGPYHLKGTHVKYALNLLNVFQRTSQKRYIIKTIKPSSTQPNPVIVNDRLTRNIFLGQTSVCMFTMFTCLTNGAHGTQRSFWKSK